MSIAYNTLSGTSLFKQEILNTFLLHIPHASTHIPDYAGFEVEKVEENLACLTDWATDEIFDVNGVGKIIAPFSRLFCDVERFDDEAEPMYKVGRGFFYTNGYDGAELRKMNTELKEHVYRDYYQPHHELFFHEVNNRLKQYGVCHVIDCHSFNDDPLGSLVAHPKSPDICIGTDEYHTPEYLLNYTMNFWARHGYSVEMNNPYSGCIIPSEFFRSDKNVKGIMIEVNKRLYMNGEQVNPDKVRKLNMHVAGFFENL